MKQLNKQTHSNSPGRWLYVIIGIIIMMCLGTVYSWSVFRLHVENLYDVGTTESGLPYMFSLAFYAFFMFLTGKHLDKYSPKLITSFGAILVAIGWILSAYAPNIYVLTLTYGVVIGSGVGIAYGAPMTVVAKWFPEKKGFVVGLILTGFGLSPLITAPIARFLIESYGLVHTFKILGIAFGIIMPILSLFFKYPIVDASTAPNSSSSTAQNTNDLATKEMLKCKNFKSLYLNFMIGSMIGLMIVGMTSNVGIHMLNLPSNTVSLFISFFAIFNGLSRPIFGSITEKLSPKKAMILSYSLIIFAASLMLIAKEGHLILFVIAFSILWFNLGAWLSIAPTSTLNLYGTQYYSQNYGVVFTAYGIGAIIGVLASGLLLDLLHSYKAIFYFIITLCAVGILLAQRMELPVKSKSALRSMLASFFID